MVSPSFSMCTKVKYNVIFPVHWTHQLVRQIGSETIRLILQLLVSIDKFFCVGTNRKGEIKLLGPYAWGLRRKLKSFMPSAFEGIHPFLSFLITLKLFNSTKLEAYKIQIRFILYNVFMKLLFSRYLTGKRKQEEINICIIIINIFT